MKVLTTAKVPIKMWVDAVEAVESEAITQLRNTADLPFIHKHVAVMPDVHVGTGATVGSVVPTKGAIVPACVGVDIGCGMLYLRTNLTASDLPTSLRPLRDAIENAIPLGKHGYGDKFMAPMPKQVEAVWASLEADPRFTIVEREVETKRASSQVGTLGGGNHFIEIVLDQHQQVGILLHSGSRGIGNKIGQHYIELAKEDMRKHFINLPDRDLAYLSEGTEHFDDYVAAVEWAQDYALANRKVMLDRVLMAMRDTLQRSVTHRMEEPIVSCHHNYVSREHHFGENVWVTRKGAVRAREGDLGIIPGSMGAKSFIVKGKGNPESFMSCSHGAGRRMSRTAAKATISQADHEAKLKGIECRTDGTRDETPDAYKNIDAVMESQKDLCEPILELHQVLCVKG